MLRHDARQLSCAFQCASPKSMRFRQSQTCALAYAHASQPGSAAKRTTLQHGRDGVRTALACAPRWRAHTRSR
eukprot:2606530-Pleurochrysis_carterae.AAC.1